MPEVCKLLNKPRTKKEAKTYYKIETEDVEYKPETEDSVSETEIQNILTHYKKLGKNTDRYVESFNNIAAQYNDSQLRVITKFLPIGVKAVLEAESEKYQSIMTFGEGTYRKAQDREEKKHDIKMGFIDTGSNKNAPRGPVVIPSVVNKGNAQRLTRREEPEMQVQPEEPMQPELPMQPEIPESNINNIETNVDNAFKDVFEEINNQEVGNQENNEPEVQQVKKGRGRPKKISSDDMEEQESSLPKRRGRPRKQSEQDEIMPGIDEEQDNSLPGFDEIEENTLPGFDNYSNNNNNSYSNNSYNNYNNNYNNRPMNNGYDNRSVNNNYNNMNQNNPASFREPEHQTADKYMQNPAASKQSAEFARFLSRDKKVVAFVGTTKAGTSFLINNLADLLSKSGINTAIMDVTTNKNSYYIYTKNEEALRRKAQNCLEGLEQGAVEGIEVSKNLSVFTSVPGKNVEIGNIGNALSNLVKQYSLVLLDCDFDTPQEYFTLAQEIYLVQSMDILTIQPLTAFLRDLQSANVLDTSKLKIIINKAMNVRGLSTNAIIGGMSCYNDPEMSYMRDLFNKDKVPSLIVTLDLEVMSKYLSGMVDCIVTTNGYTKPFMIELKRLADMVYPLINNRFKADYSKNNRFANAPEEPQTNFSSSMNSTLDRMKQQFK